MVTFTTYLAACQALLTEGTVSSTSTKIVQLALAITIIRVETLSTTQVTQITTIRQGIDTSIVMIQNEILLLQESIKAVTGSIATTDQITTGEAAGKEAAEITVSETIVTLRIIMKHISVCSKVAIYLKSATEGGATSGTLVTSAEFVTLVQTFITLITTDVLDIRIFSMFATITTSKVTLTSSDISIIKTHMKTVQLTVTQMEAMVLVLQNKIVALVSTTANPVQITSGSIEATTETATEALLLDMKALTLSSKVSLMLQ